MPLKRIVLITEGHGDVRAAPKLISRLLTDRHSDAWSYLLVDPHPIRIGGVETISGRPRQQALWLQRLQTATLRKDVGGILLLLDGDKKFFEGRPFCPVAAAKSLAKRAHDARAGAVFSLAVVFACQEFESWLIAGIEPLAGASLEGRPGVKPGTPAPDFDVERRRGAKEWLRQNMVNGYKQTTDQLPLTERVDLELVRSKNLRSFRRLEHALSELVISIHTGQHSVTPR